MSQALIPPTLPQLSDTGVDHVCKVLQSDLGQLAWLSGRSLGRIYPQRDEQGGQRPWVFRAEGEYYEAYPNDELDTFSALLTHDDERLTGFGHLGERTLSVIVWVNLKALEQANPSIESLKHAVINRLRELSCVSAVSRAFDHPQNVYPGFSLAGLQDRFNAYPYRAFRIEIAVNYYVAC
ncbi:hypothetical protein [Larkinella soli]|uniref:hypothetical protein n=1 Tax=Larkinella soli TaxID=1770527 RepID=UPI000FFC22A2|nr:hypothetical protein [Larkinella soli]